MPCPAAAATAAPARQFVPWREHVTRTTGVDPGAGTGQQVLLLCDPVQPPRGWVPRVHGLAGEPRELQKRALEATRIAPAVPIDSWERLLDEPRSELLRWPPGRLLSEQLDAVCRIAGHARLAAIRCQLCALDAFCKREFGMGALECMRARLSATRLRAYLRARDEASLIKKRAAEARGSKPAEDAAEDGGGAASAALSLLGTAKRGLCLQWDTESAHLDEFRGRQATREGGGAARPRVCAGRACRSWRSKGKPSSS